jgi:Pyruvate/2-oxoacid:ferredoxin oxidoreductase gamma subunit
MLETIICAGLGGQGVLTAGKILLHVANDQDLKFTWFPAYGNEMRGGSASCNVVLSDEKIASPYCDHPDIVMAMSESAIDEWEPSMASGGTLFVNSTVVPDDKKYRDDIVVVKCPVTEIAQGLNNERNANICMLGKIIKKTKLFDIDDFNNAMCAYFESEGKGKFNAKNTESLMAGYNA